MKKLFVFLAFVFLMQKSFSQCGTTVSGGPFILCGSGCNASAFVYSTGGTPPYSLYVNSVFLVSYTVAGYGWNNICPGNYTCIVVDATFSCSDTFQVTVTSSPDISLTLNVANATCGACCDGSINAVISGGVPPYSYTWSNGNWTATCVNACVGAYSVYVTDGNGCSSSASATVAVGNCSASFAMYPTGSPHDYWVVNSSTGAPTILYDWNWGDGSPHDNIAFPTHTYASAGIYNITLTITDGLGCTNMQTYNSYLARMEQVLTVTVVPSLPSGTEELSEENIFVYPNPSQNILTIATGAQNSQAEIYNVLGEKIFSQKITSPKTEINLSNHPNGIYFVQLRNNEATVTRKIILSK